MSPRQILQLTAVAAFIIVLSTLSIGQGFGEAWLSQYTYATSGTAQAQKQQPDAPVSVAAQSLAAQSAPAAEPAPVPAPEEAALSKRVVEYHMSVQLDEHSKLIAGTQSVTWTNPGKQEVSELYFHLYPNAFQSDKTTFMRESGGQLRNDQATAASQGYMEIKAMQTSEGVNVLPRLHYVQPDDGNSFDQTLAKLRLPDPVKPGQTITLELNFEVKLPEVFARMGFKGDFIMAGQWFPKLAVYEPAGTRGRTTEGWNTHQYHGNSEFYSDFGMYNVRIQVPERYTVAATGFEAKPATIKDGLKTYQYYADDVHDFAWSASPDFLYYEEPFSSEGVPGVRIKLYLDPLHQAEKERYMHAAKTALAKFGKWYGEYPYTTLSVVVPPSGASGAGGMEYPTLVTAAAAEQESPGYDLERTVVHEIGHQYFYGMLASNEFEEAWLDEGFTSYAEDKVMESEYGLAPNFPIEASYMTDPAPLKHLSWAYSSHDHYAENVYIRAKLALVGIERQVGEKTMQRILRTYFQQFKFNHPTTSDFQHIVEKVTKSKWNDYFNQFIYGNLMADYGIERIQVKPISENGEPSFESSILIRKYGGTNGPIPIELKFTDGTHVRKLWDGQQSHVQMQLSHSAPLEWAAIDPERTNALDNRHTNNFLKAELSPKTGSRWSLGITKVIEGLLSSLSW